MHWGRKYISVFILFALLFGIAIVPSQADIDTPDELTLTLEKAVEIATENNPGIAIAKADRQKKSIEYSQARDTSRKVEDSPASSMYEGHLATYLMPKIAERNEQTAEKVYQAKINEVKIEVEERFYALLRAQEQKVIAENALKRADEQVRITKLRFDLGTASKAEVLGAEAGQSAARMLLTQALGDHKQKMMALNSTLGLDIDTIIKPQGIFKFDKKEFEINKLLKDASENEITIIKVEDAYLIAKWSYEFVNSYYGGRYWDTRKGEQDMIMAELGLKQTKDGILSGVQQAYHGHLTLAEQYQYALKTVELQKEAYKLKELSYELGMATLTEVQEASDAVKKAEADLSECIHKYNVLTSRLKYGIYGPVSAGAGF